MRKSTVKHISYFDVLIYGFRINITLEWILALGSEKIDRGNLEKAKKIKALAKLYKASLKMGRTISWEQLDTWKEWTIENQIEAPISLLESMDVGCQGLMDAKGVFYRFDVELIDLS